MQGPLPLRRPTMKAVLIAGFALVVGLWAYTGYEFTSRMAAVEDQSNRITARYLEAQESLTRIRSQLLVASVYVRDALLEPDDEVIARYEGQLEDTYLEIDRALGAYVPVLGTSAERDHVERLRREIDQFRQMTRDVLRRNANGNSNHTRTLLAQNLVPRREAALRVSEEVQALNRTAFVQHQRDIADVHRIAERRTWQQVGLAVLASLVIAWIFSFYAGRLETRLVSAMEANQKKRRELQRLSTRLIGAQEEERRTIARELHDEVGQTLTALKVELSVAARRLAGRGIASPLAEAEAMAHAALQTVRDVSQLLHPALLDEMGLVAAVEWQARMLESRHGIRVEVEQQGLHTRLPRDVERAAYRIVQEALTNVAKHAGASTCRVELRRTGDDLEVLVEDDGHGFDVSLAGSGARGLGLAGMQERAALLAGRVLLESGDGAGTRVRAALPVRGHHA